MDRELNISEQALLISLIIQHQQHQQNNCITMQVPESQKQYASATDNSQSNIKQSIRKRVLFNQNRNTQTTKYTEKTKQRMLTEPIQEEPERQKIMSCKTEYEHKFGRLMRKNQPDPTSKVKLAASLRNKEKNYSQIIDYEPVNKKERVKFDEAVAIQKKHNKGPLNKKVLETWLESILTESTQFEVIDQSIGNAALKKFQIDENSLLSRGIKKENVSRIYRALFVHSIGFNNNLRELTCGKQDILESLWKVFSVLLEYCSQGKLETVVGSLEREKAVKLSELEGEIIRKQEVIQRNDELNELRNVNIFKEVKHLRNENIDLKSEKDVLYEDYQKTEQAFNEEVELRLRFENKINELFGVHRQLVNKHKRLYEDHKARLVQLQATNAKNSRLVTQNKEMKLKRRDNMDEISALSQQLRQSNEIIEVLKEDKIKLRNQANFYKKNYDDEKRVSREMRMKCGQVETELKNMADLYDIKDKSEKQVHKEYKLALSENSQLYNVVSTQRTEIQSLLDQKKNFNQKVVSIMAEASFENKKRQQFAALFYQTDRKLAEACKQLEDKDMEIATRIRNQNSLEQDLLTDYENIKKMHHINSEMEEELRYLRTEKTFIDEEIGRKSHTANTLKAQAQRLMEDNAKLKSQVASLEHNLQNTSQGLQCEIELLKKRLNRMEEEKELMESSGNEAFEKYQGVVQQLEKYIEMYNKKFIDYKNERFERVTLQDNYTQSLYTIKNKNQKEKEDGIRISELTETLAERQRDIRKMEYELQRKVKQKEQIANRAKELEADYQEFKTTMGGRVHQMVHEDISSNYLQLKEYHIQDQITLKQLKDQIKESKQLFEIKLQQIQESANEHFENYKKEKEKEVFHAVGELEYEKEKAQGMKERLDQLQDLADTYAEKIKDSTDREREKVYTSIIEAKQKSIEELSKKLQIEVRNGKKLSTELNKEKETRMRELNDLKQYFTAEEIKREQQINELKFEIKHGQHQAKKLKEELKEQEQIHESQMKEQLQSIMSSSAVHTIKEGQDKQSEKFLNVQLQSQSQQKPSLVRKVQHENPDIKSRNQIARKMKMTYDYYRR